MNSNQQPHLSAERDPYCPDNISLYNSIYGKNLISLGGEAAIDNLFSGLNPRGLKALDLGSGLGGVAFYLAEHYQMIISGIEIYPWMAEHAEQHKPSALAHLLDFNTYNSEGEFPFKSQTFDLVFSKGVLNHVDDKESLFHQVNRVIKPSGLFVIADWIYSHQTTDKLAGLVCETEETYRRVLTSSGFGEIQLRDDSLLFLGYAKELLKNLSRDQTCIKKKYGEDLFNIIWNQHEELITKIKNQQKFATRILAKKITL
ncbi:MAG: methyltransferase domain-containing protein [Tatlockia sp.]|nr:methyltransferase domain-containing protein [Tatlockia sp.]